jgi:hypothetical protein
MQSPSRRAIGIAAVAAGVVTFVYRLALVRDLTNDHYMHLAWAQQVLFGQIPGRDFVDPGMPLMYLLSAAVQWIAHGPFYEALLTCVLLAVAAAATLLVTTELTGSLAIGVAATACEVALEPRLYSYPKILVPAVALLLIQHYARAPSRARLMWLAVWTAVAVLLRHDLGVYAAAGVGAALVAVHIGNRSRTGRALVEYAALVVLVMLPYVVFVQWAEGLGEHFHAAVEFAKGEAHQRFLAPPWFPFWTSTAGISSWNKADAAVFLFYAAYLLAIVCLVLLIRRPSSAARADIRSRTPAVHHRAVAAAGLAMLLLYLVVVLRHPIESRLPDIGAVFTIMGGWALAESARRGVVTSTSAAALVAACLVNIWVLAGLGGRVKDTGIANGPASVERTIASVKETGTVWPWQRFWPAGEMPAAVRYLNACTTPDESVLLTWAAPEYYFFAQRKFGAGHALFLPPDAFTTTHDQDRMLEQIGRERIPIVLINETRREEFARAYPEINRYISEHYTAAGHFDIRDGSRITVAVDRRLKSRGTYAAEGWPCDFERRAASSTAATMLDGSAMPLPAMSNAVP